ncbi:MAG: 2-C-methyl-D-erythritol 2,4-cyclodiphosphate synthase [Oscillospiraceae bacterium]|nr:2-C-methyl-D-erythritol 2,4-cyclodiphosphate synthase [Oscillospiraceae bacterium]
MRIGHGYDVHKFAEGRQLVIGGVTIPAPMGLLGHSDADVLTHALCDALLGAAGLPDIGVLFPDTSDEFEGICSLKLLEKVMVLLREKGFSPDYADCTIIAQTPKMMPHISKMRENLSGAMGIASDRINIKATTEEGLGFTGEKKGIAAHSVVILSE